jgi:glucose/arabinose dehydrogenase
MRTARALVLALACSLLPAATAAAQGPPPPTAANGATVETVAGGLGVPTQFAFPGNGVVFTAVGPPEEAGAPPGGVYALRNGSAVRLPGSPAAAFGVVWRKGTLYITAGRRVLAWSKWNGTTFKRKRLVHKSGKNVSWFTGLAYAKGRLWTGVSFSNNEFKRSKRRPYDQSYVSLRPSGKGGLTLIAKGLRQPWMSTFVNGRPYLTVLAQDNIEPSPPDYIVIPRKGQDYGFPKCTRAPGSPCKGFAKPIGFFQNHASPMGIGALGKQLYVALFGGLGQGPTVVSLPLKGGTPTPFLTGYVAPVVSVGINKGWLYTGDVTGTVYRVRP